MKQHFHLNAGPSHRGQSDVETVCGLSEQVFAPRLTSAGILGFEKIARFSRLTPVAKCLRQIVNCLAGVSEKIGAPVQRRIFAPPTTELKSHARWVDEILMLSRAILADGVVMEAEVHQLQEWLTGCP